VIAIASTTCARRLGLHATTRSLLEETADIIFGIDRLVADASTLIVLRPGDLLLTGSPAGNAAHHGNRWLRPGDVMEGEITGLGVQRNVCVEESAFRPAGV